MTGPGLGKEGAGAAFGATLPRRGRRACCDAGTSLVEMVVALGLVATIGYCLTPTDLTVSNPDTHYDGTAKAKVATCSASPLQKWNAPPYINKPLPLTDIVER